MKALSDDRNPDDLDRRIADAKAASARGISNAQGKAESRGCVRLRNEDVAEVYDLLGVGSEVVIQR